MTALIIILIIVLVITALLLLRVKIVIKYADELVLYVKILFFKIKLIPKKEKKIKISDYTKKKYLKRQKKEAEKEKKKLQKKAKKEEEKAHPEKEKEKPSILETIRLLRLLLSIFLKRFFGHLRIDVARLKITVAAEDAAKTAVMYGYICQSVAYIVELLDKFTNLRRKSSTEISVTPDFTAEKPSSDIHIALSMTVWQALDTLFHMAFVYVKSKLKM